jgi:hypothetical protein
VVTADALHTHANAATFLVEAKQAHYLFTVKPNQPSLLDRCAGPPWQQIPELDRTRDPTRPLATIGITIAEGIGH